MKKVIVIVTFFTVLTAVSVYLFSRNAGFSADYQPGELNLTKAEMILETVSGYTVFLYGGPGGNQNAMANVSVTIPDAYVFLRFYEDGSTLPVNYTATHTSGRKMYYVSYHYKQLSNVIDILRNEKPVKFFYRLDNNASYLTVNNEPVGEGE